MMIGRPCSTGAAATEKEWSYPDGKLPEPSVATAVGRRGLSAVRIC
jgi:hypothetical protein